jgi:hypothetical protein
VSDEVEGPRDGFSIDFLCLLGRVVLCLKEFW